MTNLELELRGLAPFVELPPERDLAPAVRARIGARRPRPGKLVLALALVVVALAVAFAVPPARSAILRWLGLGTARIEFVDKLPNVRSRRPLDLGPRTSLAGARRQVRYHVVTSKLLGTPKEVHVLGDQVGFVYGRKVIVLQSEGTFFTKEVGPGTHVEHLSVNGREAFWISGASHFFGYIDGGGGGPRKVELYLVGNALIWQHDSLTMRLEGKLSRAEAVRLASSFR
jgi:hypothetical protein